jgi:hypothetical protein
MKTLIKKVLKKDRLIKKQVYILEKVDDITGTSKKLAKGGTQGGNSDNSKKQKNAKEDILLIEEKRLKELQIEEAKKQKKAEEERKLREAEEEKRRKEAEEEIRRIQELEEEEDIKRAKIKELEEQEELRRIQQAEEEERRIQAELEAKKKREAEEARLKKEAEEARKKKEKEEEEARKKKEKEEEEARKKQEEEEEEARKKQEEEEAEEARKKHEEDAEEEEEDADNEEGKTSDTIKPFERNSTEVIRVRNRGEIISIGAGGLGYKSLIEFYDIISLEHNLYSDGLNDIEFNQIENLNIHFSENLRGEFKARGVIVDSGDKAGKNFQEFCKKEIGKKIFNTDNYVYTEDPTNGNYAKACNNSNIIDMAFDTIRKEIEKCDCLMGVQFFSSAAGGAGSAYISKIRQKIFENNSFLDLYTHLIMSDPLTGDDEKSFQYNVNTLFSLSYSGQSSLMTNIFGYENLKEAGKKEDEMCKLIGKTVADLTCLTRFSSGNSNDYSFRPMMFSLIPFPRMNFVLPNLYNSIADKTKPSQIVKELYEKKSLGPLCMKSINDQQFPYISTYQIFRGNFNKFEVNKCLQEYSKNIKVWDNTACGAFPTGFLNIPAVETKSCVRLANNSCIGETLKLYIDYFDKTFENDKSRLSTYVENGIEEGEITQILSDLNDKKMEYNQFCSETDDQGEEAQ